MLSVPLKIKSESLREKNRTAFMSNMCVKTLESVVVLKQKKISCYENGMNLCLTNLATRIMHYQNRIT